MNAVLRIKPPATIQGEIRPPSDKSLTHRAYMFSALARGTSFVRNPLMGEDCQATLNCLAAMGLRYEIGEDEITLHPAVEWNQPASDLDCGNSGTTMRLLSGLIASRPISATLSGDASLSRRPMKRIAEPLRMMGASIEGDTPPLHIIGSDALSAIDYMSPVASAQIKSCVLLAGLRAKGTTWVTEPSKSRDHTERMLRACGVVVHDAGLKVGVDGGAELDPFEFDVPADISSAAFWMVAAAMAPDGHIILHDVGTNPTRTGIFEVFSQCKLDWFADNLDSQMGEPVSRIEVRGSRMGLPFTIEGDLVPRLIDEIPVLAVLATQLDGTSVIRDARELRVKESDRIEAVAQGLRAMGATVRTSEDGMEIDGPVQLHGAEIDAQGDHRLGMAFAVAGLGAEGDTVILGSEAIQTSYPNFESDLWSVYVI